MTVELSHILPCDSLYVSPHADDVLLSCPARILSEARRGLKLVVVTLFGEAGEWPKVGALEGASVQHVALRFPEARRRDVRYTSFREVTEGEVASDDPSLAEAAEVLTDLAHRTRASQVYVPLAVGSHLDHRIAHEASLRAFRSGDGRNVFLYEERPEALVRGAVRVRLGQVGARLPPAAVHAADPPRLGSFLWRVQVPPVVRGDLQGWPERLRSTGLAARQWRQGRAWQPQKGFGPRLQPIVQQTDADVLSELPVLGRTLGAAASAPKVVRLAGAYTRRLGGAVHAERLWLLLPDRAETGATIAEEDRLGA